MDWLRRYRATGADLPFGDPRRAHPGVAMEGYFWRLTDATSGLVVIALLGVNQGPDGAWATLGIASSDGFQRMIDWHDGPVLAHRNGVGARAGDIFRGDAQRLRVDLGEDCRIDVALDVTAPWPRRRWGGSSVFQAVPALNQYWHPWCLGGTATGEVCVGGQTHRMEAAQVYAEKNWGKEGFPDAWWWGQAHGFAEVGACVAFAGGQVHSGPLRTEVTGLVVRLPDGHLIRLGDPLVSPVRASIDDERWRLRGRGFGWQIDVDGSAPLRDAHVLPVPLPSQGCNTPGAIEHLAGDLTVRVQHRGHEVWSGRSSLAGLEHGGLARAEAELRRRGGDPRPR